MIAFASLAIIELPASSRRYIGAILFQDGQDAIPQIGGTSADSLVVMLAFVDHLVIVDPRQVHVPVTSYSGSQEEIFLLHTYLWEQKKTAGR
jgi:hypothetical protein